MIKDIFWFTRHGKYGFLSNFYPAKIWVDDKYWLTTEHYYQAMKSTNPEERIMIQECDTPKEAKFAGYHVHIRPDWEKIKVKVMMRGIKAKFTQHPELAEKLLATKDARLHEDSPWDAYWGYKKGAGQDMLGKCLMEVRTMLQKGIIVLNVC